jgi:hypothetical protein
LATFFTTGCNVAHPDPNAVWLELEFPHAKYPFIQYTDILRQITEKSIGECRPLDQEHFAELIKEGYKKVYYYNAALSLFASADGNGWQPVKFYYLSYGFPPKRNESYDSPDTYSLGFDGFESWESYPVLDFGKKNTIFLKVMVRPHDKNLPEKYCVIQLKRPQEKRSTGDKYLLFLNFAPRYPYTKISLPPWEEWKEEK